MAPPAAKRRRSFLAGAVTAALAALSLAPPLARLHPLIDLVAQFLLQAAAATLLALAIAMLRRHWAACAALGLCLAAQFVQLRPHAAAGGAEAAQPALASLAAAAGARQAAHPAAGLKAIHLNLSNRNRDYARTIQFLEAEDADIVSLVEVTPAWRVALKALEGRYPFRADCTALRRCDLAIFAKIPWQGLRLDMDRGIDLPLLEARFALADGPLTLFGTHLARPFYGPLGTQWAQAERLAGRVAAVPGRKLVLGDLNAVPWGAVLTGLARRGGVVRLGGIEGTWPSILPFPGRIAIDHALVDPSLAPSRARTGPALGSDHLPVIVEVRTRW
ncbi:MAG: endonuclease/exonuclease/phosphatase family protein [Alphaproteobacteria bacterium]|nr:endonuclease/exonuclease/phosphatase family protein [Alphaproteobacteria bacterium]